MSAQMSRTETKTRKYIGEERILNLADYSSHSYFFQTEFSHRYFQGRLSIHVNNLSCNLKASKQTNESLTERICSMNNIGVLRDRSGRCARRIEVGSGWSSCEGICCRANILNSSLVATLILNGWRVRVVSLLCYG